MEPETAGGSWRRWMARHLEALFEVGRARLELQLQSWRRVLDETDPGSGIDPRPPEKASGAIADRIERAIRRVDRFVPGATCIHRAVAARRMLGRRGVDARVVIGLKSRGDLEGHAWIEIADGTTEIRLFTGEDGDFRPVTTLSLRD